MYAPSSVRFNPMASNIVLAKGEHFLTGGITVCGAGYTSTQSDGNAAGLYYFWGAPNCMTELLLDATGPRVLPTALYEEAAKALEVGGHPGDIACQPPDRLDRSHRQADTDPAV